MPSKPRPKTFVAVVPFRCAGSAFAAGDTVPPSVALNVALRFGDRFVSSTASKSAPSDGAAESTPTPIPAVEADPKE